VNLRDLLEEESTELPGVASELGPDGSLTWSRAGRPFAVVSAGGATAEYALDPAVADAAARTPDVTLSGRGPGWVTFAPTVVDDPAADRAAAWFASAFRRMEPRN
jgi:hypothetical protein